LSVFCTALHCNARTALHYRQSFKYHIDCVRSTLRLSDWSPTRLFAPVWTEMLPLYTSDSNFKSTSQRVRRAERQVILFQSKSFAAFTAAAGACQMKRLLLLCARLLQIREWQCLAVCVSVSLPAIHWTMSSGHMSRFSLICVSQV
jgi:hypothetical protein